MAARSDRQMSVRIEAEEWAPGEWTPADDNSDVKVTLADGSSWVATFFVQQHTIAYTEVPN